MRFHRRYALDVIALCCVVGMTGNAQNLTLGGGNQTMVISTAVAGAEPTSVVNTTCNLTYAKQKVVTKITVATSCPGQKFGLTVLATSVTKGTAAPAVALVNGNAAMDLITNISKTGANTGSCALQYTASATFAQGNSNELGDDVHTITYTFQAQ